MKIKPIYVFVGLTISFLLYSLSIYTKSGSYEKVTQAQKNNIAEGRLVWQKYNCQSCHQFYGLGGYLGPDLTNVYSKLKGNEKILKALFKGGVKQMPTFELTSQEEDALIDFLKATDASGNADPRNYKLLNDGMIEQNGRK
ncbi:MAG: cytochrome c [Crocinitomicaceae bacterium]